jgi:DNA repair exonuclease SbcCD ATPase subunit
MITLSKLKIKAFRSFVDEVVITFPSSGMVLVNGKNIETNDASGTGKSSIFYAIAYALNILPSGMAAKDLQSFLTKEKMQVNVELREDGNIIYVNRGKDTSIEYGGDRFSGADLVNQHLEKIFGMNSEMLFTLVFRPQNSQGLFLSKTDTEKKEFLTMLLNLDLIEKSVDESQEIVKQLTKDVLWLDSQISSKREILNQIKLDDTTVLETDNSAIKQELLLLNEDKEKTEKEIAESKTVLAAKELEIKNKYALLKTQARQMIAELENADKLAKKSVQESNEKINKELAALNFDLFTIKAIKSDTIPKLKKEIDILQKSICPKCERGWETSKELQNSLSKLQELNSELEKEQELLDKKTKLESNIQTFEPNIKIAQLELVVKDLDVRAIKEMPTNDNTANVNKIGGIVRKISTLTERYLKNNVTIEKQKELITLKDTIQKDINTLESTLTKKQSTLQIETDFCKVLGKEGFLGSIFDEVLNEIVHEINNKLSTIANMSSVVFNFKTESVTTKGTVKKSIVPVVNIRGHENKISALSGGMLSSLDLITDLSVKDVIERRTNKKIGFCFIDEAFNGQGGPTKEACLEILNQNSSNRTFYLIDHHSEVKEYFNQIIEVEMQNGMSKIV